MLMGTISSPASSVTGTPGSPPWGQSQAGQQPAVTRCFPPYPCQAEGQHCPLSPGWVREIPSAVDLPRGLGSLCCCLLTRGQMCLNLEGATAPEQKP